MKITLNLFNRSMLKRISFIAVLFVYLGFPARAFATFIDFNDLNPIYDPIYPCWCTNPLTDQYLDQGLEISGAWVTGTGPNNVMLTSNSASLNFIGDILPTFFSMNVTSHYGDAIIFDIYSPSGLLSTIITSGWRGTEEDSTPVIPNEFISFSSDIGISSITIDGLFNMRIGAAIDNLTFTNTSVPEPSPLVLFAIGLFGLGWRRCKMLKRS